MRKFGCLFIIIAFNLSIGVWASDTILSWFGKDVPLFADMIIGLVTAELSVPVAVVGYILKLFGVF